MNHHHHHRPPPPPPPPQLAPPPLTSPINHQTTTQLLRHTTSIFISHIFIFIFLASLIFIFRSNVDNVSHLLTSFIDRDPSLKSLFDLSSSAVNHRPLRRRRPFLHLTRVGTLDDDFFSGDSDLDRSLFHSNSRQTQNSSSLILSNFDPRFGFSHPIIDDGILIPQAVRPGFVAFKPCSEALNDSVVGDVENENGVVDLQLLMKGIDLARPDVAAMVYLVGLFSAAYAYGIFAFLVTYTWAYGIVFIQVVDDLLGNRKSFFWTAWDGANLGLRRLCGFFLMRWAVRDALAQVLGIWSFGVIDDQFEFLKVSLRMKLMPFSDVAPWVAGHEKESLCFMLSWFLVELLVGFMFAVDSWIAIVDTRWGGREVVREGCHLLLSLIGPAIEIKGWEAMICGSLTKRMLGEVFGQVFATAFQSVMEVYFMVAWLMFYLAAKSIDASSLGRAFGRRELQGFLEGIR